MNILLNKSIVKQQRIRALYWIVYLAAIILIFRLGYLQIIDFHRYETLSRQNQLTILPIAPPRGIILDRRGEILADNIPVYSLELIPERVANINKTITELRKMIPSISEDEINLCKKTIKQSRSFVSIPLKFHLNNEEVALFTSKQHHFPGVSVKARLMRYYPIGPENSHVIGYVGRINIDELKKIDNVNYNGTNFIGKSGIEKFYEDKLHGKVGFQQLETDVSGRAIRTINKVLPIAGEKIYLTIDMRLQTVAYKALGEKRGAAVVINPRNGEILALVSTPGFDPNLFVNGISYQNYDALAKSLDKPLYNRALRGLYPPASTIKPYVALAGLDANATDIHHAISDPGWFRLPGVKHVYHDWRKGGHGMVNVMRAITVSCDTFFYTLGVRMGIEALSSRLAWFGFGQKTNVDLPDEVPGILPNPEWKRQVKHMTWYPGDTVISAIGQGFNLASPLQLANAVATLSMRGIRHTPHLLLKSIDSQDDSTIHPKFKHPKNIKIANPQNWNIVIEGMHNVITQNEGTGYRFGRDAPYSVAAKTGTAQVFGGEQYQRRKSGIIPERLRDNSLFIAFSPVEKPEIAVAVMVENDVLASQVARQIMDAYYALYKVS